MSLRLAKNGVSPYDYLSEAGAMVNPAVANVTIDKSGGTVTSNPVPLHLVAEFDANIRSYTGITITPSTPQTGITWEMSPNGTTGWVAVLSPADMGDGVAQTDVVTPVWARIVADNEAASPLATGNYPGEFAIAAVENPPA